MSRFIIFGLLFLVSCSEKVIEKPDNLIPEDQMRLILYDIAIINGAKKTSSKVITNNNIELMSFIYEKYKIDSLQFVQSDEFYASTPSKYQEIYEAVKERIVSQIDIIEKEENRIADSIDIVNTRRIDSLNALKTANTSRSR